MKRHSSLLTDFKNGNKSVKTFSKGKQILLLFRKFYRKIGRKLIIYYSHKMQPLVTKCFKSVTGYSCWFLKKCESHLKNTQKQVKPGNRSSQAKN